MVFSCSFLMGDKSDVIHAKDTLDFQRLVCSMVVQLSGMSINKSSIFLYKQKILLPSLCFTFQFEAKVIERSFVAEV